MCICYMDTSVPEPVKIAYLLMVHESPGQVNAFVRQILDNDARAQVFIHVDADVSPMGDSLLRDERVHLLPHCVHVSWGDFTQVEAMIALLKAARETGHAFDFFTFRSGLDLAIRANWASFLSQHKGWSFFEYQKTPNDHFMGAWAYGHWFRCFRKHYACRWHPLRVARRVVIALARRGLWLRNACDLPSEVEVFWGTTWMTLSPAAVEVVLREWSDTSPYVCFFKNTLCPDERCLHTLVMNSEEATRVLNEDFLYEDRSGSSPRMLTEGDFEKMKNSGKYFARKIDVERDAALVEKIVHHVEATR